MASLESLFLQTVALVNEPPGSLVYYLVLLFALEAATLLALSHWRQTRGGRESRLALGLGTLFLVQGIAFAVAVAAALGVVSPLLAIPPVDRAASALTLIIIIWLFALPEAARPGDVAAASAVVATLISLGLSAALWTQDVARGAAFYNGSTQETAWELAQLALLIAGMAFIGVRRQPNWALGVGLLVVLSVGHVIHYLFPLAGANVAGAERLARIVALPLLTALAYRLPLPSAVAAITVAAPTAAAPPPPPLPAPPSPPADTSPEAARRKWALDPKAMVALISVSTATNPAEVGQIIAMAVARSFIADVALLLTPPDTSGKVSIACAFNLIGEKFLQPNAALPLGQMPELAVAFNRAEAVRLTLPDHEGELKLVGDALNIERPGPAMVVPLIAGDSPTLGALALFSPFARREWSAEDQNLLMALVEPTVAALKATEELGRLHEVVAQHQEQSADWQEQLEAARNANTDLAAKADRLDDELFRTREEMERQHAEAEQLVREVQAQQATAAEQAELAQMVERLRAELQAAQAQGADHSQLQAELEAARERLQRLAQLEADLEHARQEMEYQQVQNDQLTRELTGTRAELRRLMEASPAPAPGPAPAAESAALLAAQKAVQAIQSKLEEQTRTLTALREQLTDKETQIGELHQQLDTARASQPTSEARLLASSLQASLEVIASISQDLRQPMSSIVGYSDLLMGESVGILGALQRKFLERIKASCERMAGLLDDLIRVTALDSGKLELTRESLDVVKVVEDAILDVGAQFREKGLNLKLNIADDLPAVTADRDAFKQILGHLLENAGSASAIDGEVTLTVQRESEQPPGGEPIHYLFISVRDTGGGIAPEDQPRVFSRLYRADAPLIAGLGDTGVGLSIAKALVEAHAGRIWVNSDMGQGSTFCVLLPVEAVPALAGGNGSGPVR